MLVLIMKTLNLLQAHVHTGMYGPYLKDWFNVFPRDQIYVTRLEDYSQNRTHILDEITDFLGIGIN